MTDYLQPVAKAWRIASIVGCMLASVAASLVSLVLWADMVRRHSILYEGKPIWIGASVSSVMAILAGYAAWRLVRREKAANGVTFLPQWFIQIFGFLFFVGLCFVAYHQGLDARLVEGGLISLTMVFIGWHIARRQRKS